MVKRRIRWAVHVVRVVEIRDACGVLVERPEGRVPLGRLTCRWEDNIKMEI
jgi:hypothetical protein